jgi:hypothetical protein
VSVWPLVWAGLHQPTAPGVHVRQVSTFTQPGVNAELWAHDGQPYVIVIAAGAASLTAKDVEEAAVAIVPQLRDALFALTSSTAAGRGVLARQLLDAADIVDGRTHTAVVS